MKKLIASVVLAVVAATPVARLGAHCEVPCGIYDDDRQFAEMHEDYTTIAKAITGIEDLTGSLEGGPQPLTINQVSRWVATKEAHANNTQQIIAQYFMTQRIKADDPKYVDKLTKAHAVLVAAMKCKQTADPASAEALHSAIDAFQAAYTGKPVVHAAK